MTEPVPNNVDGVQTNTEDAAEFSNENEARHFFEVVKQRLFSVNHWHALAGSLTANFTLTDREGKAVIRKPQKSDYFKIKIPAPGSEAGEGYDWVRVEEIVEESDNEKQIAALKVRPAPSPVNDMQDVAHFFSDDATSSFVVRQRGNKVTAGVYGRNEKPNTDTETIKDKIRNAAVAAGALTGFSKLQWKSLVSGLLGKD